MALNNSRRIFLYIIFTFLLCAIVYADEAPEDLEAGYFIDLSGDTPRIIQRFVWEKEEYASHYEITIQALDGFYKDFIVENTDKTFFEVSLQPGKYQYSVASFDLLGLRADASSWKQFEIIAAFVPQVNRFIPEVFYLDRDNERELHITGANIKENSKIYLTNDSNELFPVSVTVVNDEKAVLVFDDKTLIPGAYDIFIINPSGLGAKTGTFTVGYKKPLDIFINTAYAPVVPIYGDAWDVYGVDLFLSGYSISMELISSKRNSFNGGVEISASIFFLNSAVSFSESGEDYMEGLKYAGNDSFFGDIDFNFSFQKRLFINRLFFTFRFGIGVALFTGFDYLPDSAGFIMKMNASFSAMFKIYKALHLDIGADYSHYLSGEPFGLIRPKIGLNLKL